MNSAERVKILLEKQIPDRMGLYEHFWPETLKEYWPEQGYPVNAESARYFGFDLINCGGWFNTESFPGTKEIVEETDDWSGHQIGIRKIIQLAGFTPLRIFTLPGHILPVD